MLLPSPRGGHTQPGFYFQTGDLPPDASYAVCYFRIWAMLERGVESYQATKKNFSSKSFLLNRLDFEAGADTKAGAGAEAGLEAEAAAKPDGGSGWEV